MLEATELIALVNSKQHCGSWLLYVPHYKIDETNLCILLPTFGIFLPIDPIAQHSQLHNTLPNSTTVYTN
jgi:hypothetical protein